jgi:ABC-type multidrug transport system fused ATPase/permease subunit
MKESSQKYKIVNWLNEINIARASVRNAGTNFHLTVIDEKLNGYINARKSHFRILVQQYGYLILFKILIALCLLIVGGLLVVNQEMNIGQFVASEIIIVLVLSSVEKIVLNLDLVYDVLTSIEKIGQVTDLPIEERKGSHLFVHSEQGIQVEIKALDFRMEETTNSVLNQFSMVAKPGQKVSIISDSSLSSKSLFLILLGHLNKYTGTIFLDNQPLDNLDQNEMLKSTGAVLAEDKLIFGSVKDNIFFGRTDFQLMDVIERLSSSLLSKSHHLNRHRNRFTTANTQTGDALGFAELFQRIHQRHNNTCAGCPHGVSERTGAAVDIHFAVIKLQLPHGQYGHHGKGFVDFPQVNIGRGPAGTGQYFFNRTNGRTGEFTGVASMTGLRDDACHRR